MSRHHGITHHRRDMPGVRAVLAAQLPMACIHCGQPVTADQVWDVGHIHPAMMGTPTNVDTCTAVHRTCNRRDGGRIGASITNAHRRTARGLREW